MATGWGLSFGVLAGVLAAAIVLFLAGVKKYRQQGPLGSPLTTIAQVVVAAARKWRVDETRHGWRVCYEDNDAHHEGRHVLTTLGQTNQFRY